MSDLLAAMPALAIASLVALSALAHWLAWRLGIPAILPLLTAGFLVGPLLGWVQPTDLVGESLLFPAISLAVGLILFEGGLTLTLPEVKAVRGVVLRLVSLGALVTWLLAALAAWWLVGLPPGMALLFGALIIVTGPTVIGPLLRTVRPVHRLGSVLKWEGILIDPIGAMVAVLMFEFIIIENRATALGATAFLLLEFVTVGTVVGVAAGMLLAALLKRRLLPDHLTNVSALALVFAAFAGAGALAPESGLLATTLMGMIVGNRNVPNIRDLLDFKQDLTVLSIGLLFVVLAADIDLNALVGVLNGQSMVLLLVIIAVVRPAGVLLSTWGSQLPLREKAFLAWTAPRGIVAAAIASLFASKLEQAGFQDATVLVPLVFLVIVGTVLLSSLTARPVARLLGVSEPDARGYLILGAHGFARQIATLLKQRNLPVVLADTNWVNVAAARRQGFETYYGNLLSDTSDDEVNLSGIGRLIALTENDEANALVALKYARIFGHGKVFQLEPTSTGSQRLAVAANRRARSVFGPEVTFQTIERLNRQNAGWVEHTFHERPASENPWLHPQADRVPMFLTSENDVAPLSEGTPSPEGGETIIAFTAGHADAQSS